MDESTSSSQTDFIQVETTSPAVNQEEIQPEGNGGNLFLPRQEAPQKEILISLTPFPTPTPIPIQYNFFNLRVLGVVVGVMFLLIYIRGLKK